MNKTISTLSLLYVCMAASAQEHIPDSTDIFYKHLQINEVVVTGLAGDSKIKEMSAPVSLLRPADLAELASNGEHEGTFRYEKGNKDLKAEYSLQGDLGIDFSSRHVSVQAALFASRIDNYIFAARNGEVSDEGLPVYAFKSGLAHLGGGEIGIDVHPIHQLHLSSVFSCVYAREKGGDYLPLIPAPRLYSEIKWEITHDGKVFNNAFVSLNLDWTLAQNRYYAAGGTETATPSYLLLGAAAGTDVVIRGKTRFSIYLIGTNLTDRAYMSHLSRLKPIGICNMGRNISFKIIVPW